VKSAHIQKTNEVYEVVDTAAGARDAVLLSISHGPGSEGELTSVLLELGFSDKAIGRGLREANKNGSATITRSYGWNPRGAGS